MKIDEIDERIIFDTLDQEVGISSSTVNSEQLNDKESNLSLLNTLIEDRLSVDTITEDMEASEEIKEKIIFWKTKLSSKIRRINSDSIQLSEFWNLENLGIEAEVSDEENIDNDIMSEFEAGISYQNKRYKVKFPWKPNMKTLLENNEEVARKRFLKLRSRFKNDSSLFEDYKLVVNNYLSEKIIERVPFEEENLKHNIFIYHIEHYDKASSKKYVDIFPDTFNHLNQSLYVDDFLCGNDSVQAALTTCIESKQILEDATSKVLGVGWNEKSDTFYFDSSDLGTFLSKRINTKGYLLQAAGRLFDPGGRLKHSTLSEFQKHQMMLPKATNFKGARNILNEWNEICKSNRIQLFSAEEGIEWNFIPPASPHFGGLWEANIKSMKRILLRVAKSAIMNFEELTTLMAQIEAVLNSRPLSPLSSDPNDLNPLTPGHFLTNCAISSFPEPYTASDSLSYHSRWKLTRAKWSEQIPNLKENQLVLLKDPNTKPLDWPMGRILEVFPGSDGLVRVVNVKTSTGILKRAITKVVPLPIPVDPATVEKNI
ncbi:integrase catalytic domain-containing protein [Trichonephila clavipes]|nr:integrase catalytic domain-containing protein [Trichonephila clavipes]